MSLTVVAFSIVLALFASLAMARFRFRGRASLFVLLLVFQMVPFEALLIPIFIELNKAGLVFTIPALIIAYIAPTLPFTIWTLQDSSRGCRPRSRRRRGPTAAHAPRRSGRCSFRSSLPA